MLFAFTVKKGIRRTNDHKPPAPERFYPGGNSVKDDRQKAHGPRVERLTLFRVVIASFLLLIAAIIQFRMPESLSATSIRATYIIVAFTYLLSIVYFLLLKSIQNVTPNVYLQSSVDILLITGLVYATGGIASVYSTLYPLVIIYSVLFLGRRGGLLIASASSIMYGLLVDLEFYGLIHPLSAEAYQSGAEAGTVFLRICVHIASFYIVALLASFLVEIESRTKTLLSEKENAFDQLDILHKSIIESVGSGIMTVDLEGRIKSFNRAAEKITRRPASEAVGKSVDYILPDFSQVLVRVMKEGKPFPTQRFEMILPSEENDITLGFSIYPLLDPEGSGFGSIFIFQDLTSIKEMEREIEKNRKLALLGEMSAVLAHEMRSPLASISGSIRLLMESLTVEGSDRRLMEIVLRGKDQLENLARDFLLFARPDNRSRSRVAVGDSIREVIESVRFSPGWSDRVDIITDLCERNEVHGNVTEIRQALLNLVLNAFQAMPDGGRLELRTRLGVDNHGAEVLEISISDTGCGIEEEQMKRVGEPFYTTKEKGTGLGLAIVNRIAESHGGSFRIESVPNKRTVCTVVLPVGEQVKR